MLIVRRRDFSGLLGARIPETDLGALAVEAEWLRGDLLPNEGFGLEGVRALADNWNCVLDASEVTGRLLRDFGAEIEDGHSVVGPPVVFDG